jgi:AraC-like DNA-binding protein
MALPLRRGDPPLRRWLERQAEDLLAHQPRSDDVRDQVRRILAAQSTAGDLRVGTVARRLATTPRTLQRRLAAAGTSFEALCDDTRRQAADGYLADTTLSLAEVAYLLGYSEPAAFHRAFRRWHPGTTPLEFRSRNSRPRSVIA